MTIAGNDIAHIAKLAKLELSQEQTKQLSHQLANVLQYMQQLNQLDTQGVVATYHAVEHQDAWRADKAEEGLAINDALGNAPQRDERNFIVPKII